MAIKIFDVDPESTPKPKVSDVVGRFRSGQQLSNRPIALDAWRITTGDPEVAKAVAEMFGGTPGKWETQTDEVNEVLTDAKKVRIILDGPNSVKAQMVLWGRNALIRSCDGVKQNDEKSSPCVCPSTVRERKDAARAGHGCEPSVQVYFTLADAPELGRFKFFSGSWSLASEISNTEEALEKLGGPAYAMLELERVSFTAKDGKDVSYVKPVVTVLGPVEG